MLNLRQPLVKFGLMNLLHVPYFWNSPNIWKCVKLLLYKAYYDAIWLDHKICIIDEVSHVNKGCHRMVRMHLRNSLPKCVNKTGLRFE